MRSCCAASGCDTAGFPAAPWAFFRASGARGPPTERFGRYFQRPSVGTGSAEDLTVVTGLRTKLAPFALIVGLLAGTAGPLFAQDRHPVCEAKEHDCGKPAKISSCCCGDLGQVRDASVPAQARTELTKDVAVTLTLPSFVQPVARQPLLSAVQASPPTLFATLLI